MFYKKFYKKLQNADFYKTNKSVKKSPYSISPKIQQKKPSVPSTDIC